MKKIFMSLIFILFLIPTVVLAETKVEIKSITLLEKSENTVINNEASTDGEKINLDLIFYDKDDYAAYKVVVKNNNSEGLYINDQLFKSDNEYISYLLEYKDGNNFIKPGEEKEITIKTIYNNEVPKTAFKSAKYDASNVSILTLSNKLINVPNTLKNLGIIGIITYIAVIACIFISVLLLFKRKLSSGINSLLILLLILLLPKTVSALLRVDIPVDSKIIIKNVLPTECTFEGNLVQGAQYVNGQYTYRYMQEATNPGNWNNITTDGWGVKLTDYNSTDPVTTKLCTYINGKPLVSMRAMFYVSKAPSIDFSSFDTSNITNMSFMFYAATNMTEYDLSTFDTSNVTDISYMFYANTSLKNIDLKYFDTSKVTNMDSLLYASNSLEIADLTDFSFDKHPSINYLFIGNANLKTLILDGWDMSYIDNLSSLGNMFNGTKVKELLSLKRWKLPSSMYKFADSFKLNSLEVPVIDTTDWDLSITTNFSLGFASCSLLEEIIGIDTWDTSTLTNIENMFKDCFKLKEIEITKWDLSNVLNASQAFYNVGREAENVKVTIKDLDMSSATSTVHMFNGIGYKAKNVTVVIDNVDMSSSTSIGYLFAHIGREASDNVDVTVTNFNAESVTNVQVFGQFYYIGYKTTGKVNLTVKNANFKSVNDLDGFFCEVGSYADETNITVDNIDFSAATDLNEAFQSLAKNANKLNLKISNLKATNATSASETFYTTASSANYVTIELSNWDTPNLTSTSSMFTYVGANKTLDLTISNLNTSKVTNMRSMFYTVAKNATDRIHYKFENFDTSKVTNMRAMFNYSGSKAQEVVFEGLDKWDFSKVTNMDSFLYLDSSATDNSGLIDLGTLDLYATDISQLMFYMRKVKATINLHVKPTSYIYAFNTAATLEGSSITVNYTSEVDNIDQIIATKSDDSSVVKGSLIED